MRFYKMQALGNDFIILPVESVTDVPSSAFLRRLADRRRGIGADQIMVPMLNQSAKAKQAEVSCLIFNADGSESAQCGNGLRCVAHFLRLCYGFSSPIQLSTGAGLFQFDWQDGVWCANMGKLQWDPADVPFLRLESASLYALSLSEQRCINVGVVGLGNPHVVYYLSDAEYIQCADDLAMQIAHHTDFPAGVNVGLAHLIDRQHIDLHVYERGVGFTPACGSGACAAMAVGRLNGWLDERVEVKQPGGILEIGWSGEVESSVMCTGSSHLLFEGLYFDSIFTKIS